MEAASDADAAGIRSRAASARAWLDAEAAAGRAVHPQALWDHVRTDRGRVDEATAQAVLSRAVAMPAGSGYTDEEIRPLGEALLEALMAECDGTYSDDPSDWSLSVGSGTGNQGIPDLVDSLARRLLPRIREIAVASPGEALTSAHSP